MSRQRCEQCTHPMEAWDGIHYGATDGTYRWLCTRCFNAEVAQQCGMTEFENVRLDPIEMIDGAGQMHRFHLRLRLLGDIVVLDALESPEERESAYKFRGTGASDEDVLTVAGRLVEKMRRALSVTHLVVERHQFEIADQTVRGRIESDLSEPEPTPLVVIDGKEIRWDDFGRMLMAFEGWHFKLDIADLTDEL